MVLGEVVNGPGVVRLRLTFLEREILCYGGIVGNVSKGASGGLWVTAQPLWQAERAGQRATQLTGCETSVLKTGSGGVWGGVSVSSGWMVRRGKRSW